MNASPSESLSLLPDSVRAGLLAVLLLAAWSRAADNPVAASEAIDAMRKAASHWAGTVASNGGYVWEYSTDLVTRRRGESGDLPASTVWVQAGTPLVGNVYLDCYEATRDPLFLKAATDAAHCLAYGQLKSGGWTYSIEFDPKRNRHHYHHIEKPERKLRNTTTFDDDNTQSATRFLMRIDQLVDDPRIDEAVERALQCFLKAQYGNGSWDGAWPQRYPPPKKGYGRLPTFNDNTMSDCVRTMLMAYRFYDKPDYLDSVKRCLEFYLRSQLDPPQATWAQQYDQELAPAWARRFEPPSVTGGESRGNCMLLLSMYVEFGDRRYLDAVGRCVEWYRKSRIGGTPERGVWARFYEIGTNKPLYFTKTYELTYEDDDLPVHYSFKGNYGVNTLMKRYDRVRQTPLDELVAAAADRPPTAEESRRIAAESESSVRTIIDRQDDLGRWVKRVPKTEQVKDEKGRVKIVKDGETILNMMYTRTFAANMRQLAKFVAARTASAQ